MRRGLVSGVIWGALFAVMSLWLASQLGGVIRLLTTPPTNVADQAPDSTLGDSAPPEDAPAVPSGEAFPATDPSRQGTSLASGQADSAPVAETEPASIPQTGNVTDAIVQPQQGAAPTLTATPDAPTLPGTAATSPAQPAADASPVAAQSAPQPAVAEPAGAMAPLPELAEAGADAPVGPAPDSSPVVAAEPGQPPVPSPGQSPANDFSNPVVVEVPEPAPEPAPAPVPDPGPTAEPEASGTVEIAPAPAPEPAPTPDPQPNADAQLPAAPEPAEIAPGTETTGRDATPKPVTGIGAQAPNVRTNQLATVGGSNQAPEPEVEDTPPEIETGPAIKMFAAEFDNPDRRPMMAIILLVDEGSADSAGAAGPLPFPVSYAVDASAANATRLMRRYRDAGFEVLALAPLPERATPVDVEVAFQAYLRAVPEAVAFMDTRAAAFQSGHFVATQIAAALSASGHGMVTYSRGLNSAMQVAGRAGVPAALVFRDFDGAGQDSATMLRFLDQAAFRAGQQNGVILVGRNRATTMSALLEWSGGNRAGTVALAPISAVLLGR